MTECNELEATIQQLRQRLQDVEDDLANQAEGVADTKSLLKSAQITARICEIMGRSLAFGEVLHAIVEALADAFECDRAWMSFPCDPSAATWAMQAEACRGKWAMTVPSEEHVPMTKDHASFLEAVGAAGGPLVMDRAECLRRLPDLVKQHAVKSQMVLKIQPVKGPAWVLGLHQCANERAWTQAEARLFGDVARSVLAALNNLITHRDLSRREERFDLALQSVEDGVWDWNMQTDQLLLNRISLSMLGLDRSEFDPKFDRWKDRVHPDDLPHVLKALKEHIKGESERYVLEHRLRTKSGEWTWVLSRGRIVEWDEDNAPLRMIGTLRNIDAERQAKELLLRERRLFTGGPCVVFRWVAKDGWPVEYVSPNVLEFFGHTADDFMSGRMPYSNVVHPDDLERVAHEVTEHSEKGVANFEQEYRILRPTGEVRWLYDFTVVNRDDAGQITHYEGYVLDATERKEAESQRLALESKIRHAQKLESLGILAGGIAHDFNNLLMGVLGHADLAMSSLPVTSSAVQNVRGIVDAAKQAAELTHQMLAYSGKGRFVVERISLNEVVQEMTRLLEVTLSKAAVLRFDLSANLPAVEADGSQIRQVIMNLITNAAEAVGDCSGVVSLNSGAQFCDRAFLDEAFGDEDLSEGTYVWLEVADTGCGMDQETVAKIFDPFFTTKFTGRGLGLAAVQGIIRGHGGAIRVYSELNKGTTVKVLLPASLGEVEMSPVAPGLTAWKGSGTILLIDDEETVRAVGTLMLEAIGYDVLTAKSGQEGLDVFAKDPDGIEVVLLDLTMPHMEGDEVFRELRKIKPNVQVVLSSGYNQTEIVQRFAGKGLAGFVQKPYGREALANVLRSLQE